MSGRFLADACAIIAFYAGGTMTADGLAAMLQKPAVSPITVWEITRKTRLGKLPALSVGSGSLAVALADDGFPCQPLTWADAERANALPPIHKDPMDRLLIAQARNAGLTIITIDRLFEGYGVRTVW